MTAYDPYGIITPRLIMARNGPMLLRQARDWLGMSQKEAARRAQVTQGTWSAYETGRSAIPDTAWHAVGIDPDTGARLDVEDVPERLPRGRPRLDGKRPGPAPLNPLAGMGPTEIASIICGEATSLSNVRAVSYALAGKTDLGIARLAKLLEALPELDAREIVRDLAERMK